MIKKRSRPPPTTRQRSIERDDDPPSEEEMQEGDEKLDLADLIELRKLRRARQGIDAAKLTKGEVKKKKKRPREDEVDQGGLRKGAEPDDDEQDDTEARTRRVVRTNNFTQQTNVLDVDKHMMAYIEENMKLRRGGAQEQPKDEGPLDPYTELFRNAGKAKAKDEKKEKEEGNVTNSLAMLTAIPEVDLGMDTRLKNIEETEKAKRAVAEERKQPKKSNDEEHLASTRFYQPNLRAKSDADILRDAKLEAMGLQPEEHEHRRPDRVQMATDEMVMERFKKRMRK
ncbi:hepatocellular carcinoma-associated antigen 59-domain-containing protein [Cristinia sonorae]|uniref:Hepatocellular carcinoma-associated antigen 59-domain-containing protein n=1 Tax=Cristinia sonorae TaxID=1940300 RepID=A0A8K0XN26_9AGAR|nr:hepatocellular carcinoma-associated antigen 59-domain-containing protein [Cristinia sonorae]